MINHNKLDEILIALNRQIELRGGSTFSIVVCGGSALSALGYIERTTRDIDILCRVKERKDGTVHLLRIDNLPEYIEEAAEIVARDFNLPDSWINTGPASQFISGLPYGFKERLIKKNYGEYLTIYYISRIDQIFFKLYASIDSDGYHVEDLFKLKPSADEMEKAVRWVLTQDVSDAFKLILKDFLDKKGYNEIAKKI